MNIAILITSFNRVNTTVTSLKSLYNSINQCSTHNFDIYLVDDASPDNTGKIVKEILTISFDAEYDILFSELDAALTITIEINL